MKNETERDIAFSILGYLNDAQPHLGSDEKGDPCSIPYLKWMCLQIIGGKDWDAGKANRWIGYIQGIMVARNITTVLIERDRVRQFVSRDK